MFLILYSEKEEPNSFYYTQLFLDMILSYEGITNTFKKLAATWACTDQVSSRSTTK